MPRPRRGRRDDRRRNEQRVDRRIRVPEVLVIDSDGKSLGVLPTREALRIAQEKELNLVEVSPNAKPPVCRILDYGRYKYDQKQAAKKAKRNQVTVEIKEVKFRPKVDKHDYDFKLRHVVRFLSGGDKVKCTIMFRGREMAHTELGEVVLRRVLEQLEGKIIIEQQPRMEGRNMHMQIAPKAGAWPKKEKVDKEKEQEMRDKEDEIDDDVPPESDVEDAADSPVPEGDGEEVTAQA